MTDVIGYNKQENNVNALVEGSGRLRSDLMEIRKRKASTMERHDFSVEKRLRLENQVMKWDVDLRDLRKAIRMTKEKRTKLLAKKRTKAVISKLDTLEKDAVDLASMRDEKELEFSDLQSQLSVARDEMRALASTVQRITIVERNKAAELEEMQEFCAEVIRCRENVTRRCRRNQRNAEKRRIELDKNVAAAALRSAELQKEKARVLNCKGTYVDTDVWQKGVQQRVPKTALMSFFDNEFALMKESEEHCKTEIDLIDQTVKGLSETEERTKEELELLRAEKGKIDIMLDQVHSTSVAAELARKRQAELEQKEKEEKRRAEQKRQQKEAALLRDGSDKLASKVRALPADERTGEQKQCTSSLFCPMLLLHRCDDRISHPDILCKLFLRGIV